MPALLETVARSIRERENVCIREMNVLLEREREICIRERCLYILLERDACIIRERRLYY